MSIGFFYNADIRNNGTPVLCWDAAKRELGWGEALRRYSRPGPGPNKIPEHDLHVFFDDGRDDIEWMPPGPNACYLVDTHLGYDIRLHWARQFDHVFCAQKSGAERMQGDGVKAQWLPLACHPTAHPNLGELQQHPEIGQIAPRGLDKQFDVAFVGYINQGDGTAESNNRMDYLEKLFASVPNFWITTNCFFEDMAARFARARLGFNISIRDDLNMRFFEILSTGTCLLTNTDVVGWRDLGFVDGEHFIGYHGMDDMVEKAQWALDNPLEREQIAEAGHKFVRERHTYKHRMQQLFDHVGQPIAA